MGRPGHDATPRQVRAPLGSVHKPPQERGRRPAWGGSMAFHGQRPSVITRLRAVSWLGRLAEARTPTCCLQDSSGSSTACWPVRSLQLTSEGSSSQCAPVGPSSAWWNDQRNDQRAWALVQVATQINLLTAQSTVVESQLGPRRPGYCSPVAATEPVGVIAVWRPEEG